MVILCIICIRFLAILLYGIYKHVKRHLIDNSRECRPRSSTLIFYTIYRRPFDLVVSCSGGHYSIIYGEDQICPEQDIITFCIYQRSNTTP